MLKDCALERLRDPALNTKLIFPGTTEPTFPSIWRNFIVKTNTFLSPAQKNTEGYGMRHNFLKKGVGNVD